MSWEKKNINQIWPNNKPYHENIFLWKKNFIDTGMLSLTFEKDSWERYKGEKEERKEARKRDQESESESDREREMLVPSWSHNKT